MISKIVEVNFGQFIDFIKENTGESKNLLMLEEGFIVTEFDITLNDAKNKVKEAGLFCEIVGDGLVNYFAVADTQKKIDQYFESTTEGEFEATFMNVA